MPSQIIDLEEEINQLHKRWDELNELWVNPPGPSPNDKTNQRNQILLWMSQINEKLVSLGRIKANNKSSKVIVNQLTDDKITSMKSAMVDLSKAIKQEQVFANILGTVTTILTAADTLTNAAQRA